MGGRKDRRMQREELFFVGGAHHFDGGLIAVGKYAVFKKQDGVGGFFEERTEAGFAFLDGGFGLLAFADVAHKGDVVAFFGQP